MSPNGQTPGKKVAISDNLYTVILAMAFCIVLATAAFVVYECYAQYETIWQIPK